MATPKRSLRERAVEGVVFSGGMASIVLVALIFLFVLKEALPLLKDYPLSRFLTDRGWQPTLAPP